jgi:hypothetical protein
MFFFRKKHVDAVHALGILSRSFKEFVALGVAAEMMVVEDEKYGLMCILE